MSDLIHCTVGDVYGELDKLERLLDCIREDVERVRFAAPIINVDTGVCFGGPLTAARPAPGEKSRFLRA